MIVVSMEVLGAHEHSKMRPRSEAKKDELDFTIIVPNSM
jgi:hypothetical protein